MADFAAERASALRPVVHWEGFRDFGLAALVAPAIQDAFAEEILGRLEDTGSEIGMHRNTVRARIREIETAPATDLDDPTARLNLWAAPQIAHDRES